MLTSTQRTAAQAIIHRFKTVSLKIAETEAAMLAVKERLHNAAVKYWIRLQGLPIIHPVAKIGSAIRTYRRFTSTLTRIHL